MYTCEKCGTTADSSDSLCSPTAEEHESKFCGFTAEQVCEDKMGMMDYQCDTCGSVSADPEHLCNPMPNS